MELCRNEVTLCGFIAQEPVFSHENHEQRFYRFPLCVERLSGQSDYPMIVVSEYLLEKNALTADLPIRIDGQLRSYNNKSGQGNRLILSTFAQNITPCDGTPYNRIVLSGVLCKLPTLRRTPLGRSICDLLLAVNRHYGRADYLPCIAWGRLAIMLGQYQVGDTVAFEGRIQSRTYTKQLETRETEARTAYEVSVMQLLQEDV